MSNRPKRVIINHFSDGDYTIEWYFAPQVGISSHTVVSIPISKEDVETLEKNGFIYRHDSFFNFAEDIDK